MFNANRMKSLFVVLIIFVNLLVEPAFSEGFFKKLFKKQDKQADKAQVEPEQQQLMEIKNLDPRTAAIALELTKLDEDLTERRKKEGRLDNYTKLMAKAKQRADGYEYHQQQMADNEGQQQQSSSLVKQPTLQHQSTLNINQYTDDFLPSGLHYLTENQLQQPDNLQSDVKASMSQEDKVKFESSSSSSSSLPKFLKPTFLKKKVKKAYKSTKESLAVLPKKMTQATDSISMLLKLDKKGRIMALIEEVQQAIVFVRAEYSKFVISWSPMMESALNYLGDKNLHKVTWNEKDEFDFRQDALNMLAIGHEFHLLMLNWRDELIIAHMAYKMYLESVKQDIVEPQDPNYKIKVDDFYLFQLEAIHNYILFKAWLTIDEINLEPRMKLAYLFNLNDQKLKNYESDYFRHTIFFQELFEPTLNEFKDERQQVIDSVSTAGDLKNDFQEIDEFIDDFRDSMSDDEFGKITVPLEMIKFVDDLKVQLQYSPLLYDLEFMQDLKEAKKRLMES